MKKAPKYDGTVYRGLVVKDSQIVDYMKQLKENKSLVDKGFMSITYSKNQVIDGRAMNSEFIGSLKILLTHGYLVAYSTHHARTIFAN